MGVSWATCLCLMVCLAPVSTARSKVPRSGTTKIARVYLSGQGARGIPKLLHQSWKTADVPVQFQAWQDSWKKLNPEWEIWLWTDKDNRQLVKEFYPWFLEVYDGFPKGIMRADAARYLYMHKFGGVYADLDFECLRPLEPLLSGKQVVLAAMSNDSNYDQNIPNAWLASVQGHQFWYFCLQQIIKAAGCKNDRWDWVEATTGPVMLTTASRVYHEMGLPNVTVEAPGVIYPVDWRKTLWSPVKLEGEDEWSVCYPPHRSFNETVCKSKSPDAFAITYWTHTWKRR